MNCFGPMEQDVFIVPTVSAEGQFMFCHHQILLVQLLQKSIQGFKRFQMPSSHCGAQ